MTEAKLNTAVLFELSLVGTDLTNATYNESTLFPKGFEPEKYGMRLIKD
jgi:hypothetical protein